MSSKRTVSSAVKYMLAVLAGAGLVLIYVNAGLVLIYVKAQPANEMSEIQKSCLKKPGWRCCKVYTSRMMGLYHQLKTVTDVFKEGNIEYVMLYGSLIGLIRDGGINPREKDNDIGISKTDYNSLIAKNQRLLMERGVVIWKSGIIRMCTLREGHTLSYSLAPWDKKMKRIFQHTGIAIPYTDVYPTQLRPFVPWHGRSAGGHKFGSKWTLTWYSIKIYDDYGKLHEMKVSSFDSLFAKDVLVRLYGKDVLLKDYSRVLLKGYAL